MADHRLTDHPILGPAPAPRLVTFYHDGRPVQGFEGEPIAAALAAIGIRALRTTARRGEPRGLFCAIGRCTDCAMTVDGVPNVRTCATPVRAGLRVETQSGLGEWRR